MEYSVWGGPSYTIGTEYFDSLIEAATEYMHRTSPLATRFPLWGRDVDENEYVLTDGVDGWTIKDLRTIVNGTFGYYS